MGRGAGEGRGGGGARRGAGKGREAAAERSGETGRRERERESGLEFGAVGGVYYKSALRELFIKRQNSRFFSSLCQNKF